MLTRRNSHVATLVFAIFNRTSKLSSTSNAQLYWLMAPGRHKRVYYYASQSAERNEQSSSAGEYEPLSEGTRALCRRSWTRSSSRGRLCSQNRDSFSTREASRPNACPGQLAFGGSLATPALSIAVRTGGSSVPSTLSHVQHTLQEEHLLAQRAVAAPNSLVAVLDSCGP